MMNGCTKYYGVGSSVEGNTLSVVLVELSGGIDHNSTEAEQLKDIGKLIPGSMK